MKSALLPAALCLLFHTALAQDGSLDPTFGTGGKAYITVPSLNASYSKTLVQPDGKVLVTGKAANCCGYDFAIARFTASGVPDASFDGDGLVITEFFPVANVPDVITTLALQADGKILAAGSSNQDFAIARYLPDGGLDPSFDGDGKRTLHIDGLDEIYDIQVQTDGKIVVAGTSGGLTRFFTLARFNSNGSLDAGFGTNGIVTTEFNGNNVNIAHTLKILTDGRLVVAGTSNQDAAFARYNSNGTLDASFDGDGRLLVDLGGNDIIYSLAIQPDGRIVGAGVAGFSMALVRLLSNGSPDPSFDGDGKLVTAIGTSFDQLYSVFIQGDGKILAGGSSHNGSTDDFALIRLLADGSFDNSFDGDGKLQLDMGGSDTWATIAGWGNKILIGGTKNGEIAVARLNNSSYLVVLPLDLLSFTARESAGDIRINWTTAREENLSHFTVEHSTDGNTFSTMETVSARNNPSGQTSYQSVHSQPARGIHYYRLKTTERDGKIHHSKIVSSRIGTDQVLSIVENPVRNDLRLRVYTDEVGSVQILQSSGAVVKTSRIPGINSAPVSIDVSTLASGIYYLSYEVNGKTVAVSFIKY